MLATVVEQLLNSEHDKPLGYRIQSLLKRKVKTVFLYLFLFFNNTGYFHDSVTKWIIWKWN